MSKLTSNLCFPSSDGGNMTHCNFFLWSDYIFKSGANIMTFIICDSLMWLVLPPFHVYIRSEPIFKYNFPLGCSYGHAGLLQGLPQVVSISAPMFPQCIARSWGVPISSEHPIYSTPKGLSSPGSKSRSHSRKDWYKLIWKQQKHKTQQTNSKKMFAI